MAEGSDQLQLPDPDAIMEEIFARKGPQKYTRGLSEDNWEEVRRGNKLHILPARFGVQA